MHFSFVEIGSCFFSTALKKYYSDKHKCIMVEPIKKYLDNIPVKKNLIKSNYAISDYCGDGEIFYTQSGVEKGTFIEEEWYDIKNINLRKQVASAGSNSLNKPHPNAKKFKWSQAREKCKVLTFEAFCLKYGISSIDYLLMDTEGCDLIILKSLLNLLKSKSIQINKLISFESNWLNNQAEQEKVAYQICKILNFKLKYSNDKDNNIILFRP